MENGKTQNAFIKYEKLILLAFGFLLTTLLGGFLGHYFQNRTWHKDHEDFHRHSEKDLAKALFDELSLSMGKRLYLMRRYLWSENLDQSIKDERWALYQETLKDWNYGLLRNSANLKHCFGDSMKKEFETDIQIRFQQLHKILSEGSNTDKAKNLIDILHDEIYGFNFKMIKRIQENKVGQFKEEAHQH